MAIDYALFLDYQVFLVTRMREEHVHGASPGDAVEIGFRHGGRVVTAAAVIMVAVFGSFIIRMMVIPALMYLAGKWMGWLPRRIAPLVPHVDVEGEQLRRMLAERGEKLD